MDRLRQRFYIAKDAEIAMECSPAYLDLSDIDILSGMGFNRISLGIQDFNTSVLKIINRKPSRLVVEHLVEYIRMKTSTRVNLDFVYGLLSVGGDKIVSTPLGMLLVRVITREFDPNFAYLWSAEGV